MPIRRIEVVPCVYRRLWSGRNIWGSFSLTQLSVCLLAFSRTLTANIGVAVGMNGTEVTKEASDRVLAERALCEEATVYLLDLADLRARQFSMAI